MPAHLATAAVSGLPDLHPADVCRQVVEAGFTSFDLPVTWLTDHHAGEQLARLMAASGIASGCAVWSFPVLDDDAEELRRELGRLAQFAPHLRACGVTRLLMHAPPAGGRPPAPRVPVGDLRRLRDGVLATGLHLALDDRLIDRATGAHDHASQQALGPALLHLLGTGVEVIVTDPAPGWERWPVERISDLRPCVACDPAPAAVAAALIHLRDLGLAVSVALETPHGTSLARLVWLTAEVFGRSLGFARPPPIAHPWPRSGLPHPAQRGKT